MAVIMVVLALVLVCVCVCVGGSSEILSEKQKDC